MIAMYPETRIQDCGDLTLSVNRLSESGFLALVDIITALFINSSMINNVFQPDHIVYWIFFLRVLGEGSHVHA